MNTSRVSEQRIAFALRRGEEGTSHVWRKKYG